MPITVIYQGLRSTISKSRESIKRIYPAAARGVEHNVLAAKGKLGWLGIKDFRKWFFSLSSSIAILAARIFVI